MNQIIIVMNQRNVVMNQDQENNANAKSAFNRDGSRWWKETGVENWNNGAICNWTLTRRVSSNGEIEWEEQLLESYNDFDFRELISMQSSRDAYIEFHNSVSILEHTHNFITLYINS